MKTEHVKSPCCGAKIHKHGGNRRICSSCGKTWRIRPKKQGRDTVRSGERYLSKVINGSYSLKQLRRKNSPTYDTLKKRFETALTRFVKRPRQIPKPKTSAILIVDAEWHFFDGKCYTAYLMSLKDCRQNYATMLDPVILEGKESASTWIKLVDNLPDEIKSHILAFVSDGLRGIERIPRKYNWVHQRCHFHLLSSLQKRRGKRKSTKGRETRDAIYCLTERMLRTKPGRKLNALKKELLAYSVTNDCPRAMQMNVNDFLRHIDDYLAYLKYPELGLPRTTNVMESENSRLRARAMRINTPRAWNNWLTALVRSKSKYTCRKG